MMADHSQTAAAIETANLVKITHMGRTVRFMRTRNPRLPFNKPKPPGMSEKVWMVWIEGGSYLRVRGKGVAAQFDSFGEAYLGALQAKLVPELEIRR